MRWKRIKRHNPKPPHWPLTEQIQEAVEHNQEVMWPWDVWDGHFTYRILNCETGEVRLPDVRTRKRTWRAISAYYTDLWETNGPWSSQDHPPTEYTLCMAEAKRLNAIQNS